MNALRFATVALGAVAMVVACAHVLANEDAANPVPLTNEDVVRMVAAGKTESEIVQAIEANPEAFDLTEDMLDELKLAGVPATVVTAMKRKRAASAPPAPPPERKARGSVRLVVTLNAGSSGSRTLKTPAWAGEDVKVRLMLPKENDQRVAKDLAVFLACATAEHIPDLWRSKTPLGQDMVSVARHEMLAFVPGETPQGEAPRLVLPERITADIDGNQSHDIVLGVAVRFGDRWMQLAAETLQSVATAEGSRPLVGRVKHGRGFDFKVELTAPR